MLAALDAAEYRVPTPIQAAAIEPALAGRDIIGSAQTGTGKTAAFLVPIIERLRDRPGSALVLAPTRELAEQTHTWAERLGGNGWRSALVVGGVAYRPQIEALQRHPSIVIATPGRLLDLIEQCRFNPKCVEILVLDEADRMLDMGFRPQIDRILRVLPAERQTMLFSATIPPELAYLTRVYMHDPVRVAAGPQALPPSQISQDVYLVPQMRKTSLLLSLAEQDSGNVLVFVRTKHGTDRLTRSMRNAGHSVQRLHSGLTQPQRREALEGFRTGRYRILIATDIAARGIDVTGIDRVVNFDLPETAEDYVHRVGRTARLDASGHASSFADARELSQLHAIERHLGHALPRCSHDSGASAARVEVGALM
jgi:ATP-dependent RNA helicase RhlE